ncbi:hypothetical protein D3C77_336790 [compost metagenome]
MSLTSISNEYTIVPPSPIYVFAIMPFTGFLLLSAITRLLGKLAMTKARTTVTIKLSFSFFILFTFMFNSLLIFFYI